jgi:hypothetical protein
VVVARYKPIAALDCIEEWGIFCDWKLPSKFDIDFIRFVGFNDAVLGVGNKNWNPKTGVWAPTYSRDAIVKVASALVDCGVRVHLMPWAIRSKYWLDVAVPWFAETAEAAGCLSVLFDVEKDWHTGSISASKAAKFIADFMDGIPGVALGVTGLSYLHSSVFLLAAIADYVVPQAYSIWRPVVKNHWSHSSSTFPAVQQAAAYKSWSSIGRTDGIVMGLANYWGARPAQTGCPALKQAQTLMIACAETERLGCLSAWFWSLKWLLRRTRIADEMRRLFGVYDFYSEEV